MSSKLIILRGNSGCGKSTIAKKLRDLISGNVMLIPQDVIRREVLKVKDTQNNPAVQMIYDMAIYGNRLGYDVIVEGILSKNKYGAMLNKLMDNFDGESYVYYFDVPFEETVRRHNTKPNCHEFGEADLKSWWKDDDYLGVKAEMIITDNLSEDDIVKMIIKNLS